MTNVLNRRAFLGTTGAFVAGTLMASPLARHAYSKGQKIKAVLVGTGVRDGAMSILIGIAARKSIEAGHPVRISELTDLEPRVRRI